MQPDATPGKQPQPRDPLPTWSITAAPGSEPPGRTAPRREGQTAETQRRGPKQASGPGQQEESAASPTHPPCGTQRGLLVAVPGDMSLQAKGLAEAAAALPLPPALPLAPPRSGEEGGVSPAQGPPTAPSLAPIGQRAGGARGRGPPLAARTREGRPASAFCGGEGAGRGRCRGDTAAAPGPSRNRCLPPRPAAGGA